MTASLGNYDVVIAGGGNAGLCAAIAARQYGASVLLLEQAPKNLRGGNSRHGRNLRVSHDAECASMRDAYPENEYWEDLIRATDGQTDEHLARIITGNSFHIVRWMQQCGANFEVLNKGRRSRKTVFLLGGGKALVNAYYLTAQRLGVDICYDTEVLSLRIDNEIAREATVVTNGVPRQVHAKAIVVSSGGIQSNIGWLRRYWGEAADRVVIRGAPYAEGRLLTDLLDQGAASVGHPGQCHIVAVDGRSPKFDGGIATRLDCVPYGIIVDRNGRRFYDEGETIGRRRYGVWGGLIMRCPDQIAFAISDSKVEEFFRPSLYPAIQAQTIAELAVKLELDPASLVSTVDGFNRAVPQFHDGEIIEQKKTDGICPAKTHYALPINRPPYSAFPLRPGITFSYLGVKVDKRARVQMVNGRAVENLFAAGMIMAANIIGQGYLAGVGLTIGTVFGRIAGQEAAKYALH